MCNILRLKMNESFEVSILLSISGNLFEWSEKINAQTTKQSLSNHECL